MFVRLSAAIAALSLLGSPALAQGAKPTDPQIAHIAYTAGVIDIAAAKQAIAKASNKDVKAFAQDMVRDHEAVNKQALDLVKKLKVTPEDNDTRCDADPRGLLTYAVGHGGRLRNQGWKDSSRRASCFPDGASGPTRDQIALVEVQGYAVDGAGTRRLALLAPNSEARTELRPACRRAREGALRTAIEPALFSIKSGAIVRPRHRRKRHRQVHDSQPPIRVTSSSAPRWEYRPQPRRVPLRNTPRPVRLWSGWGVRTLERGAPRLQPAQLPPQLSNLAARQLAHRVRNGALTNQYPSSPFKSSQRRLKRRYHFAIFSCPSCSAVWGSPRLIFPFSIQLPVRLRPGLRARRSCFLRRPRNLLRMLRVASFAFATLPSGVARRGRPRAISGWQHRLKLRFSRTGGACAVDVLEQEGIRSVYCRACAERLSTCVEGTAASRCREARDRCLGRESGRNGRCLSGGAVGGRVQRTPWKAGG